CGVIGGGGVGGGGHAALLGRGHARLGGLSTVLDRGGRDGGRGGRGGDGDALQTGAGFEGQIFVVIDCFVQHTLIVAGGEVDLVAFLVGEAADQAQFRRIDQRQRLGGRFRRFDRETAFEQYGS